MKRKLVIGTLMLTMISSLVACGDNSETHSDKTTETTIESDANNTEETSKNAQDVMQDLIEDNIKTEGLKEAIKDLHPTYEKCTKDVSSYWFYNEGIVLDKPFEEMTNIKEVQLTEWAGPNAEDIDDEITNTYATLTEVLDNPVVYSSMVNGEVDLRILFEGQENSKTLNIKIPESNCFYNLPYDNAKVKLAYVKDCSKGISYMGSNKSTPSSMLSSAFGFEIKEDATLGDALNHLRDLWGEPSGIKCSDQWGMYSVYWIFDNGYLGIDLAGVASKTPYISSISYHFDGADEALDFVRTNYISSDSTDYWVDRPEFEEETTTKSEIEVNTPEDIVLVFGDKTITLTKDNYKDIFSLLGVEPNNENKNGYYITNINGSLYQGIKLEDNKLTIKMPVFESMNKDFEISILGLDAYCDYDDRYAVLGEYSDIGDRFSGSTYIKYNDVPFEGVERIQFECYKCGSTDVTIIWQD